MSKQSAYFMVPGLNGKHQVKKIKQVLDGIPGVISVSVNVQKDRVAVDYDSSGIDVHEIENQFKDMGVDTELVQNEDHTM